MSNVSDDWSKGDTETWGESYFGDQKKGGCKGFVFTVNFVLVCNPLLDGGKFKLSHPLQVKHGLVVTLSKKGTDNLVVSNITIDTKAPDAKKNKEPGDIGWAESTQSPKALPKLCHSCGRNDVISCQATKEKSL